MITSGPARQGRAGRPRILYELVPAAGPAGENGYRLLAKILTSYLAGVAPDPARAAEEAGDGWGRYLVERPPPFAPLSADTATRKVVELFSELGFEPEAVSEDGSRKILLHRCPFREAVATNQEVACSVHLGLLRGALREMGAPLEAAELEPLVTPDLCIARLRPRGGRRP